MTAPHLSALPTAAACTGECQKSGPIGLAVILVLCIACYFLFKSMSKHLRKVREEFPETLPPRKGALPHDGAGPGSPSGGADGAETSGDRRHTAAAGGGASAGTPADDTGAAGTAPAPDANLASDGP